MTGWPHNRGGAVKAKSIAVTAVIALVTMIAFDQYKAKKS